jgi:hypothetical protein
MPVSIIPLPVDRRGAYRSCTGGNRLAMESPLPSRSVTSRGDGRVDLTPSAAPCRAADINRQQRGQANRLEIGGLFRRNPGCLLTNPQTCQDGSGGRGRDAAPATRCNRIGKHGAGRGSSPRRADIPHGEKRQEYRPPQLLPRSHLNYQRVSMFRDNSAGREIKQAPLAIMNRRWPIRIPSELD